MEDAYFFTAQRAQHLDVDIGIFQPLQCMLPELLLHSSVKKACSSMARAAATPTLTLLISLPCPPPGHFVSFQEASAFNAWPTLFISTSSLLVNLDGLNVHPSSSLISRSLLPLSPVSFAFTHFSYPNPEDCHHLEEFHHLLRS